MGALPKPVLYLIMSVSGTGPLWFIQLLWFFSVMLIVIRKIEKNRLLCLCENANVLMLIFLSIVIWGAAQILNTPVVTVNRFEIYGVAFLIGYFVLSHDAVTEKLGKTWRPLLIAAIVLMIVFCIIYWGQPYAEQSVLNAPLCNIYAWVMVLAIIAFMSRYGNFDNPFSRFMNKQSWGLYIFHYLPLAACAWYLHNYYETIPSGFVYLFTGIAAFGGSYVLNAVISKMPVLRWCILGINKKSTLRRYK